MSVLHTPALALAAVVLSLAIAPAARATPITYNFTVTATGGPLQGISSNGSFTYDSSSATPGAYNNANDLLTALDFTWDGITYTAATANSGNLGFDGNGQLIDFMLGDDCDSAGTCYSAWGNDHWYAMPGTGVFGFTYTVPAVQGAWHGDVTYSLATMSVPEPGNLWLFAGGMLLAFGGFGVMRRRQRAA